MSVVVHREYVETRTAVFTEGVPLDCGFLLAPLTVAYETYGTLSPSRDNAVLIAHAFTGDAHAAFWHESDEKPGWWHDMIGPGKAFDTDRCFIVCSNVLGGCKGTTGPSTVNTATGKPYGPDFPPITIRDMVRVQKKLMDHLGIERWLAVAGGSMGGMQALQWAVDYPEAVQSVIAIATALRHSAQQIALDEVGRQAIMADPYWRDGNYYGSDPPARGLAVARMLGHITYMSDASMREKFGRRLKESGARFHFDPLFEVEGYLHYRGESFIKRFDANSYLHITRAMDTYDLIGERRLAEVFAATRARFLVISFSSDWLYPPPQSQEIVRACKSAGCDTTYCNIQSAYGHDAFLVEFAQQTRLIRGFLNRIRPTRENRNA
jgi:homoserine O-acetyltransferase